MRGAVSTVPLGVVRDMAWPVPVMPSDVALRVVHGLAWSREMPFRMRRDPMDMLRVRLRDRGLRVPAPHVPTDDMRVQSGRMPMVPGVLAEFPDVRVVENAQAPHMCTNPAVAEMPHSWHQITRR